MAAAPVKGLNLLKLLCGSYVALMWPRSDRNVAETDLNWQAQLVKISCPVEAGSFSQVLEQM